VTGTDTDAFAYSNGGVASALISLPLRYMHTTVKNGARDDVENVKLIYETLLKMRITKHFLILNSLGANPLSAVFFLPAQLQRCRYYQG
jgi:hypothetical protein